MKTEELVKSTVEDINSGGELTLRPDVTLSRTFDIYDNKSSAAWLPRSKGTIRVVLNFNKNKFLFKDVKTGIVCNYPPTSPDKDYFWYSKIYFYKSGKYISVRGKKIKVKGCATRPTNTMIYIDVDSFEIV